MARIRTLMIGGAAGAALTYLFDPERGSERRARLLASAGSALARARHELGRRAQPLQTGADIAAPELPEATATGTDDDLTVLSRVESVLHAIPGFPRSTVEVEVVEGGLTLRGDVESAQLAREIVETAGHVRSVGSVTDLLRVRTESQ